MKPESNYADLALKAELAVAGLKDSELRRVAFEKILAELLGRVAQTPSGAAPGKKAPLPKSTAGARGPQAYIRQMIGDGFFKKPKTIAQVKAEFAHRGHRIPMTSLSGPLQALCHKRVLRRQKGKTEGTNEIYAYSEWSGS